MATPIAFATPVCAIAFSGKSWGDKNLLKNERSARKAAVSGCFGGGASVRVYTVIDQYLNLEDVISQQNRKSHKMTFHRNS